MKKEAKLYILSNKDWQPLVTIIESYNDHTLIDSVVIFDLSPFRKDVQSYAILSLSTIVDRIVQEYGANELNDNDLLRNALHQYSGDTLYGNKSNINFLNKII